MRTVCNQRRTAMPAQAGNRPFVDPFHIQPRCVCVSQRAPVHVLQPQLLDCRQIAPPIEVGYSCNIVAGYRVLPFHQQTRELGCKKYISV